MPAPNVATITAKWLPQAEHAMRIPAGPAAWDAFWDAFYAEAEHREYIAGRYDKAADRIMCTLEAEA